MVPKHALIDAKTPDKWPYHKIDKISKICTTWFVHTRISVYTHISEKWLFNFRKKITEKILTFKCAYKCVHTHSVYTLMRRVYETRHTYVCTHYVCVHTYVPKQMSRFFCDFFEKNR